MCKHTLKFLAICHELGKQTELLLQNCVFLDRLKGKGKQKYVKVQYMYKELICAGHGSCTGSTEREGYVWASECYKSSTYS